MTNKTLIIFAACFRGILFRPRYKIDMANYTKESKQQSCCTQWIRNGSLQIPTIRKRSSRQGLRLVTKKLIRIKAVFKTGWASHL